MIKSPSFDRAQVDCVQLRTVASWCPALHHLEVTNEGLEGDFYADDDSLFDAISSVPLLQTLSIAQPPVVFNEDPTALDSR